VLDSTELHDAWDERCEKGVTTTMEETKLFFKLNERFETFEYTKNHQIVCSVACR
jgi:hypothetical protein